MRKDKNYKRVFFLPEHISEIATTFCTLIDKESVQNLRHTMRVILPNEDEWWTHDEEAEFFSDIRKNMAKYEYRLSHGPYGLGICCILGSRFCPDVSVEMKQRKDIESVFQVVERLVPLAQMPELHASETECNIDKNVIKVFIGHGRDLQWRDLKDHLHEKHDYEVQAYEIGERAGHTIRDILEDMLITSSIAFLVMTGEDKMPDGNLRTRQNVIHETGLFQGRLGFSKAIMLIEEGVEEFSNIHGIQQIRFNKGAIKETFGDVLATIRREFPNNVS